jgi:hypothetical protein
MISPQIPIGSCRVSISSSFPPDFVSPTIFSIRPASINSMEIDFVGK